MFDIGAMPSSSDFADLFMRVFGDTARRMLGMSYEEFVVVQQRNWLTMVLGYDPQLLLRAPERLVCP